MVTKQLNFYTTLCSLDHFMNKQTATLVISPYEGLKFQLTFSPNEEDGFDEAELRGLT